MSGERADLTWLQRVSTHVYLNMFVPSSASSYLVRSSGPLYGAWILIYYPTATIAYYNSNLRKQSEKGNTGGPPLLASL